MATKPIFDDVPAWPEASAAPAPRDHNKPPLEEIIPAEFREALLAERPDFLVKFDQIIAAADRAGRIVNEDKVADGAAPVRAITDEDEWKAATDYINLARGAKKHIEAVHKSVKQPYLDGGRLVDAEKNALIARLDPAGNYVQGLSDAYGTEKLNRERAEQREADERRRKLEELAKEAGLDDILPEAEPEAKREPVRTDMGGTVSVGTEWRAKVDDYAKAAKSKLIYTDAKVQEAIDAAAKRIAKATKGQQAIPGVSMFEVAKTTAR